MPSVLDNRIEQRIELLTMKINYLTDLIEFQHNNSSRRNTIPRTAPASSSSLFNRFFTPSTRTANVAPAPVPQQPNNLLDDTFELSFTTPTSNSASVLNTLLGLGPLTVPAAASAPVQRGLSLNELLSNTSLSLYTEVDGSLENDNCSICTEEYENNDIQRKINQCNHKFHSRCLENWVTNHNTCPLCRVNIVNQNDLENN
jgi:hypothetical protein